MFQLKIDVQIGKFKVTKLVQFLNTLCPTVLTLLQVTVVKEEQLKNTSSAKYSKFGIVIVVNDVQLAKVKFSSDVNLGIVTLVKALHPLNTLPFIVITFFNVTLVKEEQLKNAETSTLNTLGKLIDVKCVQFLKQLSDIDTSNLQLIDVNNVLS